MREQLCDVFVALDFYLRIKKLVLKLALLLRRLLAALLCLLLRLQGRFRTRVNPIPPRVLHAA